MPRQEIDDGLNARLRAAAALRRMSLDIAQNLIEFGGGAKGIAKLYSPCFVQMARICSSVANSPRSACARDSSNEASSSAVSWSGGWSSPANLEEHARKVEPMVIGLSSRQDQSDGDDDQARDRRSAQGRRALLLQYLQEQAAETAAAAPQKTAATEAGALPADTLLAEVESPSYQRLEQELLAVRHAMHTGHPMPLRMAFDILRSYLKQTPIEGTPGTLAAVKDRLLATTTPQHAASALTDREKTFNLLFPLLLLSPSRPRIGRERGESIARSSAVARRWTTELWSYRAGLGLALPPLSDPSPQSP